MSMPSSLNARINSSKSTDPATFNKHTLRFKSIKSLEQNHLENITYRLYSYLNAKIAIANSFRALEHN